jgi:hypothetical protein
MSDHFSATMLKFPGGDPRLGVTLSRRNIHERGAPTRSAMQPFSCNPYTRNTHYECNVSPF